MKKFITTGLILVFAANTNLLKCANQRDSKYAAEREAAHPLSLQPSSMTAGMGSRITVVTPLPYQTARTRSGSETEIEAEKKIIQNLQFQQRQALLTNPFLTGPLPQAPTKPDLAAAPEIQQPYDIPLSPDLREFCLQHCPPQIKRITGCINERMRRPEQVPLKILLVGPSGTGKTTLARAVADICNLRCKMYSAALIADQYKDSGNRNLEALLAQAAQCAESDDKPFVLIIDEFQALVKKSKNINDTDNNMIEALWTRLDHYNKNNHRIIFITTMNAADDVPEPFIRRFKKDTVLLTLPDQKERLGILTFYKSVQEKLKIKFDSSVSLKNLAHNTANLAPADLASIIELAAITACQRDKEDPCVTEDDCVEALTEIRRAPKKLKKPFDWASFGKDVAPAVGTATLNAGLDYGKQRLLQSRQMAHAERMHADQRELSKEQLKLQNQSLTHQTEQSGYFQIFKNGMASGAGHTVGAIAVPVVFSIGCLIFGFSKKKS